MKRIITVMLVCFFLCSCENDPVYIEKTRVAIDTAKEKIEWLKVSQFHQITEIKGKIRIAESAANNVQVKLNSAITNNVAYDPCTSIRNALETLSESMDELEPYVPSHLSKLIPDEKEKKEDKPEPVPPVVVEKVEKGVDFNLDDTEKLSLQSQVDLLESRITQLEEKLKLLQEEQADKSIF